ncbi:nuclear transport factor 2 family protein [Desulfosporosinus fructosivorans]|uniref:Nuclear transport factor 2 family protein n=1 Tax=Desulfosporosinus fructosivorans TaxID=2018669 RepID=A0A4Z0RBB9_9FIRM|nr:nuclear transport factor 2 family protein [Desulfosporosinus fructosivorans]TGE39293.1 nuclear transport factor 2 family protein [Desulfosporosinus fructosivorans]
MSEDRWLIMETLSKYAWGYDENDIKMMGASFTEDGILNMKITSGTVYDPMVGRDAIVKIMGDIRNTQTDQRRHIISNPIFIKLEKNSAEVITFLALTTAENNTVKLVTTGTYRDLMVKGSDGVWRSKQKDLVMDCPF